MIRRNYDIIGTITTGGVLAILHAPWPLWLWWVGIVAYVAQGRVRAALETRHA